MVKFNLFKVRKKQQEEGEAVERKAIRKRLENESEIRREKEQAESERKQIRTKKFRTFGTGLLKSVVSQRRRQLVYARDVRRPLISSGRRKVKGAGRGRPVGSVKYRDPATGQPIGVYEYRKILSARLRRERLEQERRTRITPQQEVVLMRDRSRRRAVVMNPERQPIPDTLGTVNIKDIEDEINDATNILN